MQREVTIQDKDDGSCVVFWPDGWVRATDRQQAESIRFALEDVKQAGRREAQKAMRDALGLEDVLDAMEHNLSSVPA